VVDRTSGVPAYRQVAEAIRRQIKAGELPPGAALPSERDLVARFGVSRPTIRDAIKLLRSQGLVVAEHGRGMFVRKAVAVTRLARNRLSRAARADDKHAFLADAASGTFTPSVSVRIRFEPADDTIADTLGIDAGTEVTIRDRIMRADESVVQLAVSFLPRDLTKDTPLEETNTGPGGLYARLEEAGHVLTHFEEVVGARMPTPQEQSLLQLPDGTPVITVTRVAYTADRAVEINNMVLAADRYELHYLLPAE
jgi:GntR family transcriptional regulator